MMGIAELMVVQPVFVKRRHTTNSRQLTGSCKQADMKETREHQKQEKVPGSVKGPLPIDLNSEDTGEVLAI